MLQQWHHELGGLVMLLMALMLLMLLLLLQDLSPGPVPGTLPPDQYLAAHEDYQDRKACTLCGAGSWLASAVQLAGTAVLAWLVMRDGPPLRFPSHLLPPGDRSAWMRYGGLLAQLAAGVVVAQVVMTLMSTLFRRRRRKGQQRS